MDWSGTGNMLLRSSIKTQVLIILWTIRPVLKCYLCSLNTGQTSPTRCIRQVSNWYLTTCTKKVRKTFHWLGALVTPPFKCFCPPEGQNLPNHDENQQGSRHSHYKCVYQIWGLYMIFRAMNADKWLWPIFGCKVDQSVLIGMKLELDV